MNILKSKRLLDWNDLNVLSEVARRGSFSAAAQALGMSHVTISRRLARLGEQFDDALLERINGKLCTTAFAEKLVPYAGQMQQAMDEIIGLRAAKGTSGTVKISALHLSSRVLLVSRLAELRRHHSYLQIQLDISERNVSLRKGEADVALRLARPKDSALRTRKLADIGYGLYMAKNKSVEKKLSLVTYDSARLNLPEAVWLQAQLPDAKIVAQVSTLAGQIDLIAAGLGVGALPHALAARNADLVRYAHRQELTRELWLLVHPRAADDPRLRPLLHSLRSITPAERTNLRYGR